MREQGLRANERLHGVVPHRGDEAQGPRRRWSWRRHLRYRQELSTIIMPPVPGGGKMRLLDARPISSFCCCCRPEESCQSCPEELAKLSQKTALVLVTSPPMVQSRDVYVHCTYTRRNYINSNYLRPGASCEILHREKALRLLRTFSCSAQSIVAICSRRW